MSEGGTGDKRATCSCTAYAGHKRIRLLDGQTAITISLSSLIVSGINYEVSSRLNADYDFRFTQLAQSLYSSVDHEYVHHLQAASSVFLQIHGRQLMITAGKILRSSPGDKRPIKEFERTNAILNRRQGLSRLSCLDILESGAVLEGYKLVQLDWGKHPREAESFNSFEGVLDKFRESGDRRYFAAFDWLQSKIGYRGAYDLFMPISLIAFNTTRPVKTFTDYGRLLHRDLAEKIGMLTAGSVYDIVRNSRIPLDFWPWSTEMWKIYHSDPKMLPSPASFCGLRIIDKFGLSRGLEILGRPWTFDRDTAPSDLSDAVQPIMTVWSSSVGIVEMRHSLGPAGAGERAPELCHLALFCAAMIGAAERLRHVANGNNDVYRFCPHVKCPHYGPALCHQYYMPPPLERHHNTCGFPAMLKSSSGLDPTELYSRWDLNVTD